MVEKTYLDMADFLKAMCVAQAKCTAKKYFCMKMCQKEHNTKKSESKSVNSGNFYSFAFKIQNFAQFVENVV